MGILKDSFIDPIIYRVAESNKYIKSDIEQLLKLDDKIQALADMGTDCPEVEKSVAIKWIEAVNLEMYGKFPEEFRSIPNRTKRFFISTLTDEERGAVMYKFLRCSLSDVYTRGMDICKTVAGYTETGIEAGTRLGFYQRISSN